MRIGGLQKLTLIDYPGKAACVIFTQGCNFRCGYCHNPELVVPQRFCPLIPVQDVFDFLRDRVKYLQGVVVSGGEPTVHKDLLSFLATIKALGFAVKLDTNGSRPDVLAAALKKGLLDFVAMDVKAPLAKYAAVARAAVDPALIQQSIDLIAGAGIPHQFRTTVVKALGLELDLLDIQRMIHHNSHYRLQCARIDANVLDPELMSCGQFSNEEFRDLENSLSAAR